MGFCPKNAVGRAIVIGSLFGALASIPGPVAADDYFVFGGTSGRGDPISGSVNFDFKTIAGLNPYVIDITITNLLAYNLLAHGGQIISELSFSVAGTSLIPPDPSQINDSPGVFIPSSGDQTPQSLDIYNNGNGTVTGQVSDNTGELTGWWFGSNNFAKPLPLGTYLLTALKGDKYMIAPDVPDNATWAAPNINPANLANGQFNPYYNYSATFRVALTPTNADTWETTTHVTDWVVGTGTDPVGGKDDWDSTVPIPAAAWLFGSGLLGLIGVARRKQLLSKMGSPVAAA